MLKALTDLSSFKTTNSLSSYDLLAIGDLNLDGAVTNADIQPLLDLVASEPGGGSMQSVSEPAGILLAACLLPLAMGLFRRRFQPLNHSHKTLKDNYGHAD